MPRSLTTARGLWDAGRQGEPLYPFVHTDFYRCHLHYVSATKQPGGFCGHLYLQRLDPERREDSDKALVLSVGGDALLGITHHLQNQELGRPLAVDLLRTVLARGKALSKKEWSLLHVAVVELRDNTFIGRLFFGDQVTGQVRVWGVSYCASLSYA